LHRRRGGGIGATPDSVKANAEGFLPSRLAADICVFDLQFSGTESAGWGRRWIDGPKGARLVTIPQGEIPAKQHRKAGGNLSFGLRLALRPAVFRRDFEPKKRPVRQRSSTSGDFARCDQFASPGHFFEHEFSDWWAERRRLIAVLCGFALERIDAGKQIERKPMKSGRWVCVSIFYGTELRPRQLSGQFRGLGSARGWPFDIFELVSI